MDNADFRPMRVSTFDELIVKRGVERGNTLLISGTCGTGKTIFAMQSAYNSALAGEKVYYITFEEDPEKIKRHMKLNFGWNIDAPEVKKNLVLKIANPFKIAMAVSTEELMFRGEETSAHMDVFGCDIPDKVDRIVIDSLSALSVAFVNKDKYRLYVKILFDSLNRKNSVNYVLSEARQDLSERSEIGIEAFQSDGVILLYNLKKGQVRERALEILKLRFSDHVTGTVPFKIANRGIEIFPKERVF